MKKKKNSFISQTAREKIFQKGMGATDTFFPVEYYLNSSNGLESEENLISSMHNALNKCECFIYSGRRYKKR